jgi:hypothetical protein
MSAYRALRLNPYMYGLWPPRDTSPSSEDPAPHLPKRNRHVPLHGDSTSPATCLRLPFLPSPSSMIRSLLHLRCKIRHRPSMRRSDRVFQDSRRERAAGGQKP